MSGFGMEMSIDDEPVQLILNRLAGFDREALPGALDAIGAGRVNSVRQRFERSAGPGGVPWKPSLRVKRKGGKTLVLSTRLFGSITHNVIGNAVEWGTNVWYGLLHQLGITFSVAARTGTIYRRTDRAQTEILPGFVKKSKSNFASEHAIPAHSVTIPARPFVGWDREDEDDSYDMLRNALVRYLTGGSTSLVGPV
jgi:phage gpG-like protein